MTDLDQFFTLYRDMRTQRIERFKDYRSQPAPLELEGFVGLCQAYVQDALEDGYTPDPDHVWVSDFAIKQDLIDPDWLAKIEVDAVAG